MTNRSKKPLVIPIIIILSLASIALLTFFSTQQVEVELPPHPEIHPNLSREGSSFKGFIDIIIPVNISNHSPGILRNGRIRASLSVVSIEDFGLFPDTILVNLTQEIEIIHPKDFLQIPLYIKVSSWIPMLAIVDAYLVLDVDITLEYQIGLITFPIHLIGRIQEIWDAPFSI
ncbi:MAG: hypothetical protein ACFFAM_16585 [Promethearchaeota archaeon]